MLKKILLSIFAFITLLVIIWILGPRVQYQTIDNAPIALDWPLDQLDSIIASKEFGIPDLKEDNEARIIWADSSHVQTEYSVVYLHGFSASQGEGDPIHKNIGASIGANVYLARLRDHGVKNKDVFKELTPQDLIDDTKEAVAIGKLIGQKVILMSCSTGGTVSIAVTPEDDAIHSLVLMSPNIRIKDPNVQLMTGPWGAQIIKAMVGDYRIVDAADEKQYWTGNYHVDGLLALQALIDQSMTDETFEKINIPVFMAYYYKNEEEQDQVVSVDAMKEFLRSINTPEPYVKEIPFANAGSHVISAASRNENWKDIQDSIEVFLKPLL